MSRLDCADTGKLAYAQILHGVSVTGAALCGPLKRVKHVKLVL